MSLYKASDARYTQMEYAPCGRSGLKLPRVSLGLWQNFGSVNAYDNAREMCLAAFDHGITHFDLANNYGPAPGSAEENFGRILREDLHPYRDELIISTKAGYDMWDGPYGSGGSRKYLIASLDASLRRMGLDYVDIFYHHRMTPETPLEESMEALAQIVRSGKALYVGLSNYDGPTMQRAAAILASLHVPFVINQNRYSILCRLPEKNGLLEAAAQAGKGVICFSPLAQGLLTDRYLGGIPQDSRAARNATLEADEARRRHACLHPRAERPCRRARADAGRNGACLGAAWQSRHLGTGRRILARADSRQPRRAPKHCVHRGGACRN